MRNLDIERRKQITQRQLQDRLVHSRQTFCNQDIPCHQELRYWSVGDQDESVHEEERLVAAWPA